MSKALIRQAKPNDWQRIRSLNAEIFEYEKTNFEPTWNLNYPYTTKARKYYKDACSQENNHYGFVCEEGAEILGYGILLHHQSEEQQHREGVILYQIDTISVTQEHRNKGIGRELIEHMKAFAEENGATHILIGVLPENSRAKHLYESCGFAPSLYFLEQRLKNDPQAEE